MKQERSFPRVTISKKGEASVKTGHPWIYDAEVQGNTDALENGALIDAFSEKGAYLGTGILSKQSKIRLRLLSNNANEKFDEAFFSRRIRYALDYRKTVMGEDYGCCRMIFGEADGLPGLTIDCYHDILVSQVLSVGMERIKGMLYQLLVSQLRDDGICIRGVFERNEVAIRELEGLPLEKGWYRAEFLPEPPNPLIEIVENDIRYAVDVENGQKTGFFLDQKYNRLAAAKIARGKRVLDCFTHTGSFALNAAKAGAAHVTAVDVSQAAVELARANAEKNGLTERMDFICADVFDLLPQLMEQHAGYDMVILDPPAFTKSRKTIAGAERGYRTINYHAMKLLPRGGYLATCSCSHFMPSELFERMLLSAARDAGVSLKLIEARRQAPDHPTLMHVPETDYLKFYLFQIV
ncbi:Ribosomal RNA large subunit methyltransferase I [bioreactor metagenome]|uniref:Ribosomal RNA large subunit methyltransferase I n=1 Tax=bioreactor metagenome TaxID=1076179 RepID=A0A645CSI3_9ZZZZ|nr:class I SAM-dependent rRNA methyltransferase [Christensenella sp.]